MSTAGVLAAAMLVDAVFGEPRWLWSRLPHPVVLMGHAVTWIDTRFNRGVHRRIGGVASLAVLCAFTFLLGWVPAVLPGGWVIELAAASALLAQRSLVIHVGDVAASLRISLGDGRRAVASIVGRDTEGMDRTSVARAAVESAAENLSDGVIAPAFWFLVAGLPGLLVYKLVNTADSMIGYRDELYGEFGWAAARFDDLLNLVPARLTAALIVLLHGLTEFRAIMADAALHRSPNAGWPEAAMARVVGIALSGPRSYDGKIRDFPYVYPDGRRQAGPADIERTVTVIWRVWATAVLIAVAIAAT